MFRLAAALVLAAASASAESHLYSYEAVTKTWGLVKDLASHCSNTAHDALPPPAKEQLANAQKLKEEPLKLYNKHAAVHVTKAQSIATNLYNTALDAISEPVKKVNAIIDGFVEKFERRHPSSKGMIPAEALDRFVFCLYLYFCLKLGWTVLMVVKGIFCYFFCCGMCSKRAKPAAKKAAAKEKAKPKMKK